MVSGSVGTRSVTRPAVSSVGYILRNPSPHESLQSSKWKAVIDHGAEIRKGAEDICPSNWTGDASGPQRTPALLDIEFNASDGEQTSNRQTYAL